MHLYDPHVPNRRHRDRFGNRFEAAYDAEIAFMDLQISRLLEFLDVHDLRNRTLVVAVGDHGEGLGIKG